jgi:hypothetical protein
MIDLEDARAAADTSLRTLTGQGDGILRPWADVKVDEPVLVYDVAGPPSYWLVPLESGGRVIGFARVDLSGETVAIGVFCRTPAEIDRCPDVVTGITADEASRRAAVSGQLTRDETTAPPRFVHDGPPGREAWLVETWRGGHPHRWLFVSRGGVYERPAGSRHGQSPHSSGRE